MQECVMQSGNSQNLAAQDGEGWEMKGSHLTPSKSHGQTQSQEQGNITPI